MADIARITCPTFQIGGWRDLYADCTPRDFCAITAPKKLLMGAWKHEFPDTGREAPAAGCRNRWSWSVCPPPSAGDARSPDWGPLQSAVLDSPNDLGGAQTWDIHRDLMNDAVRLAATRTERVRVDGQTELQIDHAYGATVAAARPDLARMQSTTTVRLNQAAGMTELSCRTLATAHDASVDVTIHVDGQPFWQRHWHFYGPA